MSVAKKLLESISLTVEISETRTDAASESLRATVRPAPIASMLRHRERTSIAPTVHPTFAPPAEAAALAQASLRMPRPPCLVGRRDVPARIAGVDPTQDCSGKELSVACLINGARDVRTIAELAELRSDEVCIIVGKLVTSGRVAFAASSDDDSEDPTDSGVFLVSPELKARLHAGCEPASVTRADGPDYWLADLALRKR